MAKIKWSMYPTHSEIQFKVRHLMITNVSGSFGRFSAEVETEGDKIETASVKFIADVDSITTNNDQRDTHLKSADFFDATNYPELVFVSNGLKKIKDEEYELSGDLTIRGNKKPVKLKAEHGGVIKDPWGNTRTGFTVEGKINRKEFGLVWHGTTETGGLVVADEVRIHASVEFVQDKQ